MSNPIEEVAATHLTSELASRALSSTILPAAAVSPAVTAVPISAALGSEFIRPMTAPIAVLAGIDNSIWTAGIDQTKIPTIPPPILTVVVSQDPPAGTEVPFGTAVNLTLATIDRIPLGVLKNPGGLKFNTVGDLQGALASANLKSTVANAATFSALSAADQTAVTNFAKANGATDPSAAFGAMKVVASL